jgi:predicted ATPase with chaperone activity
VARTIADLAADDRVEREHVIAALGYRHEAADLVGVAA